MATTITLIPALEQQIVKINVTATGGKLYSKSDNTPLEFSSEYDCAVGIKGAVVENSGGSIHVTSYKGRPVDWTHALIIDR